MEWYLDPADILRNVAPVEDHAIPHAQNFRSVLTASSQRILSHKLTMSGSTRCQRYAWRRADTLRSYPAISSCSCLAIGSTSHAPLTEGISYDSVEFLVAET